ncbi:LysB family phage lysis regulatory protein [Escherichia coli]|nr:LysB family phage lysis regulatory protein [Escherichia coli]
MTAEEKSVLSLFMIGVLIVVGKVLAGGEPITPRLFIGRMLLGGFVSMVAGVVLVQFTRADKNELAQVALRQELENAAKREAQREKTITRLLNENEDFRRWYGADLPDAVRRLHQRPACTDASDCPQRLPESEPLPDAEQ